MTEQKCSVPLSQGDRIAFMTQGFKPRVLCGTITDPTARDAAGRSCIHVNVGGRNYLARIRSVRKLEGKEKL